VAAVLLAVLLAVRLAGGSSRAMLASARLSLSLSCKSVTNVQKSVDKLYKSETEVVIASAVP